MIREDHYTVQCSVPADQVRPLYDRMLVRPDAGLSQVGLIVIPDVAQERAQTGVIVAIGAGEHDRKGNLIPTTVKVGDRVAFGKLAGDPVEINGETYFLMCEGDVLGVLE